MQYTVFDIESDGLYDNVTKIHCLCYESYLDGELITKGKLVNYDEIRNFINTQEVLVGHNIIRYDLPVIEKILGVKFQGRSIDSLVLSWYLYPNRMRHGLEFWGDTLGVEKPQITDWENLRIEDYLHRCESDVVINSLLFGKQIKYLLELYDNNHEKINNLINYLCFKLDCAREQDEVKCKLDRELINKSLEELYALKTEKIDALVEAMPKVFKYRDVNKPAKLFKKDGSYSSAYYKWFNLLDEHNLDLNSEEGANIYTLRVLVSEEPGNPSSSAQIKDWLYTLGWVPRTFEYRKNSAGDVNAIAQIYFEDEVCPSIKELYNIEPALENLDMLSLINHRIGIFESFNKAMNSEDYVRAEIGGLTNTLRFKHVKPIVNLPKVFKFYGDKIRGSIISPGEEYTLCGSDMSSLEDTTKQHYMYNFDPEYVIQMRTPGFDPHLDIGVLAGMMTSEESDFFKDYNAKKKQNKDYVFSAEENARYYSINEKRGKSKTVNFAAVYGAGPPKIAQSTGMELNQAQKLHKTYWDRNKSVKQIANSCRTKVTYQDEEIQMWLYNPISGFWYSLRYEKDKFSTLNQGTGVYCFDLFVKEVRRRGIKLMLQYHDEIAFPLLKRDIDITQAKLNASIQSVNSLVKLNVPLGISMDFNNNYADIH